MKCIIWAAHLLREREPHNFHSSETVDVSFLLTEQVREDGWVSSGPPSRHPSVTQTDSGPAVFIWLSKPPWASSLSTRLKRGRTRRHTHGGVRELCLLCLGVKPATLLPFQDARCSKIKHGAGILYFNHLNLNSRYLRQFFSMSHVSYVLCLIGDIFILKCHLSKMQV